MKTSLLTDLLNQADRKMVKEAVAHLQEKFAFRNAEFLKLKSEKEKFTAEFLRLKMEKDQIEKKYQTLEKSYQEVIQEYRASSHKLNNEILELKNEIEKKDGLLRSSEQMLNELNNQLSDFKKEIDNKDELVKEKQNYIDLLNQKLKEFEKFQGILPKEAEMLLNFMNAVKGITEKANSNNDRKIVEETPRNDPWRIFRNRY